MAARPEDLTTPQARSPLRLRPMRESDLDAVYALELASYDFPWTRGIFADCLRVGYACWVLSPGDGSIAGYGILSVAAGEAHIMNVCLAKVWRGTGQGKRLLYRLIDLARWHEAERMFLEVRASNTIAQNLYRQAGFHAVGRRKGYYEATDGREDAIVLARDVVIAK